jgi:hypothetical protein
MSIISNKIEADDRSVNDVLSDKKYTIDYFQREYKWERKHLEQLIVDLEASFFSNYKDDHEREEVEKYNNYYLGPIVVCAKEGKRSIIDGQQRLTSITLLLIYLNNLQRDRDEKDKVPIDSLIFSYKYSKKSFNIAIPEREKCFVSLYHGDGYTPTEDDDESVVNIVERYDDIAELFPDELKEKALPYFIDWLKDNVIFVEINAYSDENAYTIFETMNDRGLNLTPSEMLKGHLLSKIINSEKRTEINELWKKRIGELHGYWENADDEFFKAWLRAKHAQTIRHGKKGAANEDFEKIGTRFHTWVRDSRTQLGLKNMDNFYKFVKDDFNFYTKLLMKIYDAEKEIQNNLEYLYYIDIRGIADSLSYPLLMSPIKKTDDESTIIKKLALVGRYIETFTVLRHINRRTLRQSSIRYTMYTLVKDIRNKDVDELASILKNRINSLDEKFNGMEKFRLHGQNRGFIHFLLARITDYIEQQSGIPSKFEDYMNYSGGKPFQVEHIWANKFEEQDEFDQKHDFDWHRNLIGGLILLQEGTNQSFRDLPYEKKLPHYLKENLLAQTLHPTCYEKNPNFVGFKESSGLPFRPHVDFKKEDLLDRTKLYQKICEKIWKIEGFDEIVNG